MIAALICYLALSTMTTHAGPTSMVCADDATKAEAGVTQQAIGWYNGDTDTAYVMEGLSFQYTREVMAHEIAHAWDLRKGTETNGFPSFFSTTHTGFDVEQFARLQTLHRGEWPANEAYPDVIPTDDDWARMDAAGWLS